MTVGPDGLASPVAAVRPVGGASPGARQDALRRDNLALLLRHLHGRGPASRSALGALTGLNRSTIAALAGVLVDAGLVREEQPRLTTSVGRPSLVLVPEPTGAVAVAVEVTRDEVVAAVVGLGGAVLARSAAPRPAAVGDVVAVLAAAVSDLTGGPATGTVVAGVGVAVPGLVRATDGLVRVAPNLGWREEPLGALLAEALPHPVAVANEADLAARAEHLRGAARGHDDVVYLSGQVGLGAGVISGGRPLRGHGGYAGEAGHVVVDPRGRPCHCGSRGCWETEVNEEALLGERAAGGHAAVAALVERAAAGDRAARRTLDRVGRFLGQGLAGLINVLNPEVVVLGGHLAVVLPAVRERVQEVLDTAALAAPSEQVVLALPELGADAALLGAAELAFAPLLADPLGELARVRPAS